MVNDVTPQPESNKVYLGDGAYAEFDGYQIRLTTSDGLRTTNEVYLDRQVFKSLIDFASRWSF